MSPTIRSASLVDYPEIARSVGLDPYAMLDRFRLPRSCLRNPDLRISAQAVAELRPENCIVMGDPRQIAPRLASLPVRFRRIVHFEHLTVERGVEPLLPPGEVIAADSVFDQRIESISRELTRGPDSESTWQRLVTEGDTPDLEPFVAFGPAVEMSLLIEGE